jgi:hypothetical protein
LATLTTSFTWKSDIFNIAILLPFDIVYDRAKKNEQYIQKTSLFVVRSQYNIYNFYFIYGKN